jgi:hypothetical protein
MEETKITPQENQLIRVPISGPIDPREPILMGSQYKYYRVDLSEELDTDESVRILYGKKASEKMSDSDLQAALRRSAALRAKVSNSDLNDD